MNFIQNLASSLLDDQAAFTDLTQVAVVDEEACLDVLKKRFDNQTIYTNCGPLLVAVNPYCELEGLYSDEQLTKHLALEPSEEPHVYGMAARAYQKMMATGDNQAVVISGESGAGKTETAKFLLSYLAAAASGTSAATEDARGALQRAVMSSNPIMESYGCAKTVRNDNSSRFGKLVLLRFTKTGRLEAASLQTYLLEKSRVVHQAKNECNFHCFFELLAGVPSSERAKLSLPPARGASAKDGGFAYLQTDAAKGRSAERDASCFAKVEVAFGFIGLESEEVLGVQRILVALLHLGNVTFGDADEAALDPHGRGAASVACQQAAALLGCEPAHLATGMVSRKLKAGSDWVTTANSVEQAREVRHALVKQLYSYLFVWLVKRINASLAQSPRDDYGSSGLGTGGGGAGPHIAYVDIFGFEIFQTNSLEQLCINFANEKLQRLFVGVLFESVQQMYELEGISVEKTDYADNRKVVDLIGASPSGLLSMLTEECVFPKGSDETYLQKLNKAHKDHASFVELKTSTDEFCVSHFAGEVTYNVSRFLEKNKDPISQDLQVLVEFSDEPFVASMMQLAKEAIQEEKEAAAAIEAETGGASESKSKLRQRGGGAASKMRSGKFVGVVDGFKSSLKSLIATLQNGELHFIRCLKPNDDKQSLTWQKDVSHRQLLSAGLVQAVAATREGYADHLPPQHIVSAFGPLVEGLEDEEILDPTSLESAQKVLAGAGLEPSTHYAIGRTKVFLRPGVMGELQKRRLEHIGSHATLVQRFVRGALARIMVRRLREAARRREEEKRRREDELRRRREEARRAEEERKRKEEEAKKKAEEEEKQRREKVQKARSLSFDRRRRKKVEEEERVRKAEEEAKEAKKAAMEAKRAEQAARMRERMAAEGVHLKESDPGMGHLDRFGGDEEEQPIDVGDEGGGGGGGGGYSGDDASAEELARRTEAMVARAEAEAADALSSTKDTLDLPESPGAGAAGGGGGGGGFAFKLNLPTKSPAGMPKVTSSSAANQAAAGGGSGGGGGGPAKLVEQRRMEELAASFVCPMEDVLAYAEMIGMDVHDDAELLWIADEALQAPEPVGWEQRLDPRGNSYYCNTITNMTMIQHPVDYHYQQLYLQMKVQKQIELMTPRSQASAIAEQGQSSSRKGGGGGGGGGGGSGFKLDLRSLDSDARGADEPQSTPRGWLKRTTQLLTPRSSRKSEIPKCDARDFSPCAIEVSVNRGTERLGMELNAYNQILSFQPGGPTDRHPDIQLYDRIVEVDGASLDGKMLTDVLQPKTVHAFLLERWMSADNPNPLDSRTLLALGKARSLGDSAEAAQEYAYKEHYQRHKGSKKAKKREQQEGAGGAAAQKFTVELVRDNGSLGLVCDEENVVVDMVPGSPADVQRHLESKGDPRLQIGDRIVVADGIPISYEMPLDEVLDKKASHVFSVERTVEPEAVEKPEKHYSPMSPRGLLKAVTPSKSKGKGSSKKGGGANGDAPSAAPSRALREVRLYKETVDERLGIRFVRDDDGFDRQMWGREDAVTPIVAALDPKGEAAKAGIEIDDMVLSINGQTGLSNTEAAAMLREETGTIVVVLRKCIYLGQPEPGYGYTGGQEPVSTPTPETPRSAMRRLV